MAATPPRSGSPASRPLVVSKSGHALQISPNLEALLQHDELTRRNSSSPTSAHCTTTSPEFPISLPPPPPRKAKSSLKTGQREQEPFPTTRSKEVQRRKIGSDFWPGAFPTTFPPDGSAAGQPTSGSSSRPVTPNPYLNPTPTLGPVNTPPHSDIDEHATPKQWEKTFPAEPKSELSRSAAAETRVRASVSDPSHRPSKVEKILWMGRDSLHLFSGSANGLRRNERAECGDVDAVQDRQKRQTETVYRPATRPGYGDSDTATVLSSTSSTSSPQQAPHVDPSETACTRSCSIHSESRSINCPTTPIAPLPPTAHLLPSVSMSHASSPRPSVDSLTGRDYLSFIDFFSPSTSDGSIPCTIQDNALGTSSSPPHPQSINMPPSNFYSTSCHNLSSSSLASMRFAPPSPTSLTVHHLSPTYPHPDASSSSVALSSMTFAPPSPSVDRFPPTRLQLLSGPPSPYSPLEFAPPPSPPQEIIDKPSAPELPSERGRRLKSKKRSVSLSPYPVHHSLSPLPPTTNQLDANERADRIRRNRKLARVFGRTPGTEAPLADPDEPRVSKKLHSPSLAALLTKQKNHRHALSVSVSLKSSGMKTEPSTPWQTDDLWSPGGRRHSTPLATSSFRLYVDDEEDRTAAKDPFDSHHLMDSPEAASTRSFIDLSDEEIPDDDLSGFSSFTLHQNSHGCLHQSSSTPSLVESLDSEAQAEAERRRKREKLARLHRFLGSSVPPEAVNGSVFGPPLPPLASCEQSNREHRPRGNKHTPTSSDDFDCCKEELDEREKALNVRRAQKMERVFGTPPPQVLFHTRPSRPTVPVSQPTSPTGLNPYVLTLDIPSSSRNPNQSAYVGKTINRRGPSDSSRCLLPHKYDTPQSSPSSFAQSFADSLPETLAGFQEILAQSSVYLNYQHSLNSLVDIIDRDDRRSLVELHRFLHGEVDESPSDEEVPVNSRRLSTATSFQSERRYSLPSNASITSLSSEFHASPKSWRFQIRRRKAAKLTHFFGVDYRELIHDILESIEKGVEEECKHGTLQPQEVEVLMHRVRSLRTLRDLFPR